MYFLNKRRIKMKKLILFAISLALLLSGCVSPDGTGNFQIYLKDQPIDIDDAEQILVTISEISVQKEDEGFITLCAGQIVIDGEPPHDMTVPSSEVKIPLVFNITEDGATEILLDFEAEHSIHVVNAGQSEQYILSPVIRVENISY